MLAGDERSDGSPLVSELLIVQQHKRDKPVQLSVEPTVQTQSRSSSPMQASLSEVCHASQLHCDHSVNRLLRADNSICLSVCILLKRKEMCSFHAFIISLSLSIIRSINDLISDVEDCLML